MKGLSMNKRKVSLVINTLNEENNIADCIASVGDFADEIIVCDMYSDDRTEEIALQYGATIIHHKRTGYVEPARRFAILQAHYEWILILDADERMTENLKKRLVEIIAENNFDIVSFCWLFEYFGDFIKDGSFYKERVSRFFLKKSYIEHYDEEEELIHRNFRAMERKSVKRIELPAEFYIIHLAYPTIEKYVSKTLGRYARIEAEEMHRRNISFTKKQLIFDPIKSFLRNYFKNYGFACGIRGFIKHFLYSVYRFNVWANLWLIEENLNRLKNK